MTFLSSRLLAPFRELDRLLSLALVRFLPDHSAEGAPIHGQRLPLAEARAIRAKRMRWRGLPGALMFDETRGKWEAA